jgi:DNA polymerase-3 subunit beta
MKIICSQESLSHGIQTVQKGISSRIGLPIYNGILFEANEDNKVHLFATDLEIGIDCYIPAQVIKTGSTVIPSRIISELIKKFPEGKIEIECLDGNITTVKENNSNYKILGFSAEEFSNFPEIKIRAKTKLNQKLFKEAIQQVIFATSRDENRTFLNGALFKILSRLLLDNKEVFTEVRIGEKQILFILFPDGQKNSIRIYSRLIEGQFPDYHQIIPNSFKTEIKVNTEEFKDKMERISLFVREDLNTVKIEAANKKDSQKEERCEIILNAENPSTGEASEKISCLKKGEDIDITFNTNYILDVLKIIKKENTIIKLNDPLNPVIITPDKDKDYTYILMPVRTD